MKRFFPLALNRAPLAAAAWLIAMSLAAVARAQPSLTDASPGAVAPGKTTEITLRGANLTHPPRIWTSFPAQIEIAPPADPKAADVVRLDCKFTIPSSVPVGIGGIVVATPKGISDVLYVMLDDLPSISDNNNNHSVATAQEVQLPAAIDGLCDGTTFDYYRFAAKAGQRISCELVAARLGWDFDSVVRLLDAAGTELLRADDDPATAADARFAFKAPADGQFIVELRDNRFKDKGRYRLRLGDFPMVSTSSPIVVQAGTASSVSFAGPVTDGLLPLTVFSTVTSTTKQSFPLSTRSPSGQGSGWASVIASNLPVIVESAPADKPSEATPVTLPCTMAGTLETPKDRDLFGFSATKGTSVTFRATTRSAGSAAILMLRLLDSKGTQIAESPVTDSDEPVWTTAIPADGTYQLAVEELAARGGSDYTYAVEARSGPQFTLALKVDPKVPARTRLSLADNAFFCDVTCARVNYDGPITLAIDSPRSGWQVINNVIPAKANDVRLYVIAPPDLSPAELVPLRIVGRADDSAGGASAALSTIAQLRVSRPQTPYPPAWADGLLLVSGMRNSPPLYSIFSEKNAVTFVRQIGQAQLSLAFNRLDDKFKDVPLTVLPLNLPTGFTAEIKRNGNGPKETYDIILKGPKDLAEGPLSFRYFTYAEVGVRGQAVQSGDLRINVISPLAVVAAPAGPLVAGQKQKVKLTLTRQGDDKQPVDLKFKMLPPGVTAPEKTTLAPDQAEVEVELSAAADAKPVKFDQLIAVASGKYAGADITVESPAAVLEVKAP